MIFEKVSGILIKPGSSWKQIPFSGADAYNKNIRIQFGRCPVRAVFPEALELLKKKSHLLGYAPPLDLLAGNDEYL